MSPSVESFNEDKYKALMDGLECTEISLSNLERTRRIDSEFYKKECLIISQILKDINAVPITDFLDVSDGNHMTISDRFQPKGIPYYRGQDIHNFFIESASPICIDEGAFNNPYMLRSHIKKGDVLLSIVGTIGESALVFSDRKATCSCKLAILRPTSTIFSPLLVIYLKTKYGINQIDKFKRGAVQMGYLLEDMNQLLIPYFSQNFIKHIAGVVNRIHCIMEESGNAYKKAKEILSEVIGFTSNNYSSEQTAIKTFSESFASTGRLDAEYYQPKYDDLFTILRKQISKPLGQLVSTMKSIEPGSEYYGDAGVPFIRVSDVSITGIDNPSIMIPESVEPNIDRLYPKKDTILFSKDGSVGIAFKITEDMKAITSSALLHLRVNNTSEILPDYLTLILNSEIVQLQAERDASGAIIQHWKLSDIEKVVIPILPYDMQLEIAKKVQQSFLLRKKANDLIQIAVKAVELAIEDSEEIASKWLEENTRLLEG